MADHSVARRVTDLRVEIERHRYRYSVLSDPERRTGQARGAPRALARG